MPVSVRQRAVAELARVTRSGGTVVVVDYALPANAVAAAIVYRLMKLYERDNYAEFVGSDLRALLLSAGVRVRSESAALGGSVRISIAARM